MKPKLTPHAQNRFGEQSRQSNIVHETLGAFNRGEISKRDVHKIILDTINGHDDLKQELMDILTHPEASWAPGDFELPTEEQIQPFLESTPHFLQPTHKPQMRLPSIPSSWFPLPQAEYTASSGVFGGYDSYCNTGSSPGLPALAPFQLPDSPTHTWPNHGGNSAYTHIDDNLPVPPPIYTAFRNPWEESSYNGTWANDDLSLPPDNINIDKQYQGFRLSDLPFSSNFQPHVLQPQDVEPTSRPFSHRQDPRRLLYSPQNTYYAPPPPTEYHLDRCVSRQQHLVDEYAPPKSVPEALPDLQVEKQAEELQEQTEEDTAINRSLSLGGPYIHSICGKGFSTLSKLKKHHWGKKNGDTATKTGCWAKHKKPRVAWNDHPSCEKRRSTAEAVPAPPTLDDLPDKVAKALSADTANISGPQKVETRCHDHRLASCSSFDSLLTAVNVISQIDAPKPQDRTHSIVKQLDTQVAAADCHKRHASFVPYKPLSKSLKSSIVRPVVSTVLDMTSPGVEGPFLHNVSISDSKEERKEHLSALMSDVGGGNTDAALSQPVESKKTRPSRLTKKRRKI